MQKGSKMIRKMQNIYFKLLRKLFSSQSISPEAVTWGYRLFLDREPESPLVVLDKLRRLSNTQDLRQEFVNSKEFRQRNLASQFLSLSGNESPMLIEKVSDLQPLFSHIQNVWENLGETEPYWSVLSSDQFKSARIEVTRSEFYNSGRDNVETLFKTLDRNGIDTTSLKTCLEYGCGLGRVTYWLAKSFDSVIGYDISKSHLRLAKQYLDEAGIHNVSLYNVNKPQDIGDFPKVDVVYSVIVLQHNPPPIIHVTIQELIRALNPGGIAFFQVPTYRLGYRFSLQEYLASEATRGDIEMHVLPQNEIFDIVREEHSKVVDVLEDSWTGLRSGERSNTFVIQKE
jgi:SAM-dependent methyltransferase